MNTSTQDRVEGKVYEINGMLKEQAGKIMANPDLENEGTLEKVGGMARQVLGKIEKAAGA
jgi:uncharacterized protein YjbJ (UPF0337 family)